MKGVYLASREHRIENVDLDYNDIINYDGINLLGDMLSVDINKYDFVIATPPCNYYSRANYRRDSSKVAQETKHLLPGILEKLEKYNKPFIVENVCGGKLLPKTKFYEFTFGNHHFYTNVFMFVYDKSFAVKQNKQYLARNKRDNNYNVHLIIDLFLNTIGAKNG